MPSLQDKTQIKNLTRSAQNILPKELLLELGLIKDNQGMLSEDELIFEAKLSEHRKTEFRAGRCLARVAAEKLHHKDINLPASKEGYPIWPDGLLGSISHKGKVAGVLLSNNMTYLGIGFDLEKNEKLDQSIWPSFASEREIQNRLALDIHPETYANMLFSLKESIFKALSPILGTSMPALSETELFPKPFENQCVITTQFNNISVNASTTPIGPMIISWATAQK